MKIYSPLILLEKLNVRVFFFLLFFFQLTNIFQGIDLSDEGFFASFYQQIYNQPETAQYNFMFWFSGIAGGAFVYLFPDLGLWGIRLAGVLVTTSTVIVSYHLLKKYLNPGYLKLGLLMVVFFINNNVKEIHYNDLSALLNVITICFLLNGLKQNKWIKIFLAGVIVSLSTFTRLPNILCLGLGLAIFYYGYHYKINFKKQISQLFVFGAGFIFLTAVILGIMKMTGHYEIFLNSLKLLSKMGSGDEKSFYGPMVLIKNFALTYYSALKFTLFILLLILPILLAVSFAGKKRLNVKWVTEGIKYLIVLFICALFVKGILDNVSILYFYTGLILITTLLIFFTKTNTELKLLALAGCFILVTYPFSSSAGLFTVGIYSVWLSLPIAVDYLFRMKLSDNRFTHFINKIFDKAGLKITESQLNQIKKYTVIVCLFGSLVYTYRYPWFDRHDRLKMTSSLNNKYLRGIFTTKERAAILNELFTEIQKYVRPNDYLLCYQNIPLINYVTATRPYMRNSLPWFYDAETFKTELYKGLEETKVLPVVVMQKIKFAGVSSNWPDPTPSPEDVETYNRKNEPRNAYMKEFLQTENYREVWSNYAFKILVPPQ
jgi:hypothetical protein